jgi:CrcB protein
MIVNCLAVGAGGAIGAILRYLLSLAPIQGKAGFPFATLITNILGALLIGFVVGLTLHGHQLDSRLSLFLRVGVCGGFTTFSTFALETGKMISEGKTMMGLGYILLSVTLSICAVYGGEMLSA